LAASVLACAISIAPLIFSSTVAQSQEAPMLGVGGRVMLTQPKAVAVETQEDDLNAANELLQAENYKQAAPLLERLSAQGNAVAKYKLAELYFRGLGVSQDDRMAAILYEAAAEQNVLYAQQNIAVMYVNGRGVNRDFTKAVYWFRKAALQGDAFAQLSLGNRYLNGEGVAEDYKEALSWFTKAADQGYAPAYYVTGMMYLHGKGVQQDYSEAVAWMRKPAESGYPPAQRQLGFAYLYGQGTKRDVVQAYKWLVISEELSGGAIDLSNPGWEPNMGSFALAVREQFKRQISRQQIKRGEDEVRQWLAANR
jgi:TPR repeat protein